MLKKLGMLIIIFYSQNVFSYYKSIDLHAHPFMKTGIGVLFKGKFNDKLKATSWKDRFSSNITAEDMEETEIGIMVVSLLAHPLFVGSRKKSIRKQLKLAHEFAEGSVDWEIAYSPRDAKRLYREGKKIMILALEGARDVIETKEDIQEFVVEGGIRIVTLIHFMNDKFGGAAFQGAGKNILNPFAYFSSYKKDKEGPLLSGKGLTTYGENMIELLTNAGVWIDSTHASEISQRRIYEIYKSKKMPLLYTHTTLRKFFPFEYGMSYEQLAWVKETDGVLGLMPSEDMIHYEDNEHSYCQNMGQFFNFVDQYNEVVKVVGNESVYFGTDLSGGVTHFKNPCPDIDLFGEAGFYKGSQIPLIWETMEQYGANIPKNEDAMVSKFIKTWRRAYRPKI